MRHGARAVEKHGVGIEHHHPVAGTDLVVRHDEASSEPGNGERAGPRRSQVAAARSVRTSVPWTAVVLSARCRRNGTRRCHPAGRDLEAAVGLDMVEEPCMMLRSRSSLNITRSIPTTCMDRLRIGAETTTRSSRGMPRQSRYWTAISAKVIGYRLANPSGSSWATGG